MQALAAAFHREVMATWIDPDPEERRSTLHLMFTSMVTSSPTGCITEVTDDLGAAAIWYPPEFPFGPSGEFARPEVTQLFRRIDQLAPPEPYW